MSRTDSSLCTDSLGIFGDIILCEEFCLYLYLLPLYLALQDRFLTSIVSMECYRTRNIVLPTRDIGITTRSLLVA